jgi:hypothetical protein
VAIKLAKTSANALIALYSISSLLANMSAYTDECFDFMYKLLLLGSSGTGKT